jgi:SAM-dependent methyltransferase
MTCRKSFGEIGVQGVTRHLRFQETPPARGEEDIRRADAQHCDRDSDLHLHGNWSVVRLIQGGRPTWVAVFSGQMTFWDSEVIQPTHNSWMAPAQTREYINELISGDPGKWPLDWFQRWLTASGLEGQPFKRALSVGCGTGALERDLLLRNVCQQIDAFDSSSVSIDIARREAEQAGFSTRVRYFVGDFNAPSLPSGQYDAVFFHQSAHHVGKLERLFSAILSATTRNAVIYLDEFIGPSRGDWTVERTEKWNEVYQTFPRTSRFFDRLPLPVQWDDLSEAVRSAEIVDQLRIGFQIEDIRGYGGNVLAMMYPALRPDSISDDMIARMIELERRWLAEGEPSFHAIIIARPRRRRFERLMANVRYFASPKMKRVLREISRRG